MLHGGSEATGARGINSRHYLDLIDPSNEFCSWALVSSEAPSDVTSNARVRGNHAGGSRGMFLKMDPDKTSSLHSAQQITIILENQRVIKDMKRRKRKKHHQVPWLIMTNFEKKTWSKLSKEYSLKSQLHSKGFQDTWNYMFISRPVRLQKIL